MMFFYQSELATKAKYCKANKAVAVSRNLLVFALRVQVHRCPGAELSDGKSMEGYHSRGNQIRCQTKLIPYLHFFRSAASQDLARSLPCPKWLLIGFRKQQRGE